MTSPTAARRRFLAASAGVALAPYVRTSRAAGSLNAAFWDHWVPGANDVLAKICQDWAAKEKVELRLDFVTSLGNKLVLTITAEAQAKAGHDLLMMPNWNAANQAPNLEPVDDIVQALAAQYGAPDPVVEYLGRQNGRWIAVPATPGSQMKGPCGRIDLLRPHAGIDVTKMYPVNAPPDRGLADRWTWDAFLDAAGRCHKAGYPFGIGLGQTNDSVDSVGAIYAAFGAQLVDAQGNITVDSDATRQVLE